MVKERVPVFVLILQDNVTKEYNKVEFFVFHKFLNCPTVNGNVKVENKNKKIKVIDDWYRARPFTSLNSGPGLGLFLGFGDYMYVKCELVLSPHQIQAIYDDKDEALKALTSEELDSIFTGEGEISEASIDKLRNTGFRSLTDSLSTRMRRFDFGKIVNSLSGEKKGGQAEEVSNDSLTYWETCPSLSSNREGGHLLHLRGKLYVIGDYCNDTSLIQVLEQGVWTSLKIQNQPDIDPFSLVSAALEEYNAILVGSNGSFYLIDASNENGEAKWTSLDGFECHKDLMHGCSNQPGFVVHKHFILWYDIRSQYRSCIRGFHLSAKRYFSVDLGEGVFVTPDWDIVYTAKLIDLGKGMLCLIYTGLDWQESIDNHGVKHSLFDYHFVTFKINYQALLDADSIRPFPGIQLEPTVISRRKCYAPEELLDAAFAMDADIPILDSIVWRYPGLNYPFKLLFFFAPVILQKLASNKIPTSWALPEILRHVFPHQLW